MGAGAQSIGGVSGGSVTGVAGHGGGLPFLALCRIPPSPDVLAQACPHPQQAQGGTVGNTTLLNRAKRQASPIFLWIKDPLSLENVDSRGWSDRLG